MIFDTISNEKDKIFKKIQAVYFICKEGIAFAKFPQMCSLIFDKIGIVNDKDHYRSRRAFDEFILAINIYLENYILTKAKSSQFFSLTLDESTDNSKKEQMAVYFTYLDEKYNEKVCSSFMTLINPQSSDVCDQR